MKKLAIICIVLVLIIGIASISYAATCNFTHNRTLEEKKEILENKVDEGVITKEKSNEIEIKLEKCQGTKQEKIGQEYDIGFGRENTEKQNRDNCSNCENRKGRNQGQNRGKSLNICDGTGNGTGTCKCLSK